MPSDANQYTKNKNKPVQTATTYYDSNLSYCDLFLLVLAVKTLVHGVIYHETVVLIPCFRYATYFVSGNVFWVINSVFENRSTAFCKFVLLKWRTQFLIHY